jgi:acetyl-CoA carboxylase biotin carboxyl carrier protein
MSTPQKKPIPKRPSDVELLIADFQRSGLRELHVRAEGFEIYLSNDAEAVGIDHVGAVAQTATTSPPPVEQTTAAPVSPPSSQLVAAVPEGAIILRAPYLGTFYRAPKPGSAFFVEIGAHVTAETEVCLVEVMKLFTSVRAEVSGTVHAVLAVDGQMVEADQPLFAIMPD